MNVRKRIFISSSVACGVMGIGYSGFLFCSTVHVTLMVCEISQAPVEESLIAIQCKLLCINCVVVQVLLMECVLYDRNGVSVEFNRYPIITLYFHDFYTLMHKH